MAGYLGVDQFFTAFHSSCLSVPWHMLEKILSILGSKFPTALLVDPDGILLQHTSLEAVLEDVLDAVDLNGEFVIDLLRLIN